MIFIRAFALIKRCVANMKNKKGSELAFSTIVSAAIAILILIVVVIIIGKRVGWFSHETDKCEGRCVPPNACDIYASSRIGCPKGQVCCTNYCEDKGYICRSKCPDGYIRNAFYKCNSGLVCCQKS